MADKIKRKRYKDGERTTHINIVKISLKQMLQEVCAYVCVFLIEMDLSNGMATKMQNTKMCIQFPTLSLFLTGPRWYVVDGRT